MRIAYKIPLAILLALAVGLTYFLTNQRLEGLLAAHRATLDSIGEMERLEAVLDEHLLRAAHQLYYDFDAINGQIRALRRRLVTLRDDPYLADAAFAPAREHFDEYAQRLDTKEAAILRFGTVNSLIKNSTTHIPTLAHRFLTQFGREPSDDAYLRDISHVTSVVFIANRSLDEAFLGALAESVKRLDGYHFDDPERERFHEMFLAHARVFLRYLPTYRKALEGALAAPTRESLDAAKKHFLTISRGRADEIRLINGLTTTAFITAIGLIVYLLLQTARLHRRLETSAATDPLTGLPNRFAYERDQLLRQSRNPGQAATLLLLNIDRFRAVNDFYGNLAGDALLRQLSERLRQAIAGDPALTLYRLGGDDFCVLATDGADDPGTLPFRLLEQAEGASYQFDGHALPLNLSIGVSREEPLREKADMALRHIKRRRGKVLEYHPDLGIEERVRSNLQLIRLLRRVIDRGAVVPHFQPVFDNRPDALDENGRPSIAYYECLMRLEDEQGDLLFPNTFLPIAQEGRLYGRLTRLMVEKCVARFAGRAERFSLNLSVEDILDPETTDHLFATLAAHPGTGPRLTLEILESEAIADYEEIHRFAAKAREHGCHIAIDDFGAGYSSLAHVLNLRVDNLKIDGSLIKDLDHDPNARALVSAIVEFADEVGIPAVTAEFVHNQAVLDHVVALGIHYSQGFHLGRPGPDLA
ncbi:EAL domain-containing protein [Endothiovibrio diazotrophicus]